jgi:hypothetical protein
MQCLSRGIVCGLYVDCVCIVCGLYVDCIWIVYGLYMDLCGLYVDCMCIVCGFQLTEIFTKVKWIFIYYSNEQTNKQTNKLSPKNRVLPQMPIGPQPVENSSHFMYPYSSLPHSQQPALYSQPDPDQSSSCRTAYFLMILFNIILPSKFRSFIFFLTLKFPRQNFIYTSFSPLRATYPSHLILLDFITQITFGGE